MDWNTVDAAIEGQSLLKHPFYQAWSSGKLTLEDLRYYAGQYFHMENAFPRFVSRVHSAIHDAETRRALTANLADEELGAENHRELWLRFAEGLGMSREDVLASAPNAKTIEAIAALETLASDADPAVGLSALYAYESQQPRVAASKIDGLKAFYGIEDERTLRFFEAHKSADVWHAQSEKNGVEALGASPEAARAAAEKACAALNTFLDGVTEATLAKRGECAAC